MEPQVNNNPTLQTPSITPPLPSKNNTPLIIILSTLLLGFFGTTTYLAYQNNLVKQELVSLQQEVNQPTPTKTLTPDPTADWETYTNNQYLFSISYPPQYVVTDNLPQNPSEWKPNKTLNFTNDSIPEQPTLIVEVNPWGYGPIFYTQKYTLKLASDKLEIVSKEDLDTKSIEESTGEPVSTTYIGTTAIEQNNNRIMFQLMIADLDNDKLEDELDQILSTFQFIE